MTQLDAVAASEGPGSYTGLRIGVSTAKGICYALNKPMIAISTLQALAHASISEIHKDALYIPMIDARRMEVYTATFDFHNNIITNTEALILEASSFDDCWQENKTLIFSGNGSQKASTLYQNSLALF